MIEEKWLVAVGWDAMVTKSVDAKTGENEIVFFEGNFAGARVPRRMFLNWPCLKAMVRHPTPPRRAVWPAGARP